MSTIINGTSSAITFPDTTVQNTAFTTGAVTQSTIANGVAGTGPAFSAYLNVSQSGVADGTFTKVTFDVEEFDTNNNFASSRFTPTVAGYYQINGAASSASPNNSYGLVITTYKNGSIAKQGAWSNGNAGGYPQTTVSALIYCNGTTDYIELYVYGKFGGGAWSVLNGVQSTYFQGSLVRAA